MTELETQLLNAFEQLQIQQESLQKDQLEREENFVQLYNNLVDRFKMSLKENGDLRNQISRLEGSTLQFSKQISQFQDQVASLTQQLQQLERRYNENNR